MSDAPILGPIQIECKVHFVHPDGHLAAVTYTFPPGRAVSEEDIRRAVEKSASAVSEKDFALMGPYTFFNHVIVAEKTGRHGHFAVPASFQYDGFGLPMQEFEGDEPDDEDEFEDKD